MENMNDLPKIIIGLGNPGKEYDNTRHNIGFFYIDYLSQILKIKINENHKNVVFGEGFLNNNQIILAKPNTYVNNSGNAVKFLLNKYNVGKENIIVIFDDMSLEIGKIRIRAQGSSGGHNGIKSIIEIVGKNFSRIKIGIGNSNSNEHAEYVLGKFSIKEEKILKNKSNIILDIVEEIILKDICSAMNKYN
tara:strand:+ start:134 stop:706 length:573 start_codon:yes stop_codon:yes gene_type:complete